MPPVLETLLPEVPSEDARLRAEVGSGAIKLGKKSFDGNPVDIRSEPPTPLTPVEASPAPLPPAPKEAKLKAPESAGPALVPEPEALKAKSPKESAPTPAPQEAKAREQQTLVQPLPGKKSKYIPIVASGTAMGDGTFLSGQLSLEPSNGPLLTAYSLALDYSSVASADQFEIAPSNTSLTTAYLSDNAYNKLKYTTTPATGTIFLANSDVQLIDATGGNQSVPSEISEFHRVYINTLLGRKYLEARKKIVDVDDIIRLPSPRLADTFRIVAKLFNYPVGDKKIAMAASLSYDFTSRAGQQVNPTDGPGQDRALASMKPELNRGIEIAQPYKNDQKIKQDFMGPPLEIGSQPTSDSGAVMSDDQQLGPDW